MPFFSNLALLPWAFWIVVLALIGLVVEACQRIRKAWAVPALLVYITIGTWYVGNLFQTGPADFLMAFGSRLLNLALSQVLLFLATYRLFIHCMLPRKDDPKATISVVASLHSTTISRFFWLVFWAWLLLFLVGIAVTGGQVLAIVWPPSAPGEKVGMFSRGGVGGGTDFLLSTAAYVYLLFCATFGMIFVLARGQIRWIALALMIFTWPYFLFDRTRSLMLALLVPGVVCYLLATWGHWLKKTMVTAVLFGMTYLWFGQVMHYRDTESGDYKVSSMLNFSHEDTQQYGLDMLTELCFIDSFVQMGDYKPNWGQRYFAEIANIIPRTIWPGKPLIGYDYAYARGFRNETGNEEDVYATVSTGTIGQGVANFGQFFGVLAAALLMALWTLILAKLWRRRFELPRFLLFLVGCGLTFNMGRDITLLVLWPFLFGYGFVRLIERFNKYPSVRRRVPRSARFHRRLSAEILPQT